MIRVGFAHSRVETPWPQGEALERSPALAAIFARDGLRQTGMADPTLDPANGDRGFTGHEHLDEVALVHMNGRIYDPLLARFLSADPLVGDLNDLQTYNRYSYVMNQPLRYTDPSGECGICVAMFFVGTVLVHEGNKYWAMVGQIMQFVGAQGFMEGGLDVRTLSANPMNSAAAAGASALANGQGLDGAIKSAVFAAAFTQVGTVFHGDPTKLLVAHALLGCVQSSVSGGQCGPGAMSAFVGKAVTLGLGRLENRNPVVIGIVTTIAGGTAAEIGGGKFANGAFQAGFGYIFNECGTTRMCGSDSTKVEAQGNVAGGDLGKRIDPAALHLSVSISDAYDGLTVLNGQPRSGWFCMICVNSETTVAPHGQIVWGPYA